MLSHRGESATLDGFTTLLHILHKHRDDLVLPSNPDYRVSRARVDHYFNDRILGNLDHDLSSIRDTTPSVRAVSRYLSPWVMCNTSRIRGEAPSLFGCVQGITPIREWK